MSRKSVPRRERVTDGPNSGPHTEGTAKRRNYRRKATGQGAAAIERALSGVCEHTEEISMFNTPETFAKAGIKQRLPYQLTWHDALVLTCAGKRRFHTIGRRLNLWVVGNLRRAGAPPGFVAVRHRLRQYLDVEQHRSRMLA